PALLVTDERVTGVDILTGDTNIVSVSMTLQYLIRNPAAFLCETENPSALIGSLAESVLTETVLGMPSTVSVNTDSASEPMSADGFSVSHRNAAGLRIRYCSVMETLTMLVSPVRISTPVTRSSVTRSAG